MTAKNSVERVRASILKLDPADRVTLAIDLLRNAAVDEVGRIADFADECKRKAYWTEIRALARAVRTAIQDGEITDRERLLDYVHETLDGHHDVIYTACAMDVIRYSENDGAALDDFGTDGLLENGAINWSRLAYCAMEADLMVQLDAEGIDPNGDREDWSVPYLPGIYREVREALANGKAKPKRHEVHALSNWLAGRITWARETES